MAGGVEPVGEVVGRRVNDFFLKTRKKLFLNTNHPLNPSTHEVGMSWVSSQRAKKQVIFNLCTVGS
jgi:hypothetical protein